MGINIKDKTEEQTYLAALDCMTAIMQRRTNDEKPQEATTPEGDDILVCVSQLGETNEGDATMLHECLEVAKFIDGLHRLQ